MLRVRASWAIANLLNNPFPRTQPRHDALGLRMQMTHCARGGYKFLGGRRDLQEVTLAIQAHMLSTPKSNSQRRPHDARHVPPDTVPTQISTKERRNLLVNWSTEKNYAPPLALHEKPLNGRRTPRLEVPDSSYRKGRTMPLFTLVNPSSGFARPGNQ